MRYNTVVVDMNRSGWYIKKKKKQLRTRGFRRSSSVYMGACTSLCMDYIIEVYEIYR